MTTTRIISDNELQLIFTGKRMNSRFEYEIIFQNKDLARYITFKTIWANGAVDTHA
jgi:hypothetical protein